MNGFLVPSLRRRSKAKALAQGAGSLLDIGGTAFKPGQVLPRYDHGDPFKEDLIILGNDFRTAAVEFKTRANHR